MTRRTYISAFSGVLINILLVTAVFAQGATGTLKGQVIDAQGAGVQGVTVSLSAARTGLVRTVTTNSGGRFQLQLAPGSYVLNSSAFGYSSVTVDDIMIKIGAVDRLTIPIGESAIEEIIAYGTPAPLMAAATGETGLHITLDELAQIPVSRDIESVALLAPGTVPGIDAFGDEKTLVSFGGASVAENVYYIDGLNVSDFRTGLGGSSVPFEFYDQIQIKTGGYSAEFGRSTGGVINAVTRRGGNDFELGVVSYFEPEWLQGKSPDTMRPDGSYYDLNSENSESSWTTDIYVSGPIIKDRLFFFALYEPQSSSGQWNWRGSADVLSQQEMTDDFWGGNLTWNITDNHSLSYTTFTDERGFVDDVFDYDTDTKTIGESTGDRTHYRGGENYVVSYDAQLTDNLVLSAKYGRNKYNLTNLSSNDEDCPAVIDASDSSTSFYPGCWINGYVETMYDEREAYRLDVEYYLGNHTVRAGFDREDNESFDAFTYAGLSFAPNLVGGVFYRYESWDVGAQLPNGAIVPDVNGDGSRVDTVRYRYQDGGGTFDTVSSAWYIEDTWDVNDSITVSIGVRSEVFENFNGVGDLFFDIDDQWAPRLALAWLPGGADSQRVTLNWGRYHLPIMALPNVWLSAGFLDYMSYYVFDGNRDATTAAPVAISADGIPTGQEIGSTLVIADGSVPDVRGLIDTSLEPMYQDEWILGYEREFGDDWVAGVRYIKRELQSIIEDVTVDVGLEAIGFPGVIGWQQACQYVMTNPGTDITTFCDPNGDGVLEEITIPADALGYPKPTRSYEAIELTVEKSLSDDWSLQGSYTWSKNKGNIEGSVKSDNSQSMANLTTDFDFPQLMDGAYGYLPNDRRHKFRLWSSYRLTDRLTLGANLFAQSGRPINAFGYGHPDGTPAYGATYYLQRPDGSFEFSPRGTAGRTDWITQVDLAAIYVFGWGDSAEVELHAEVFNLFDGDSEKSVYEYAEEQADLLGLPRTYQQPRYLRLGVAIRF